MAFWMLERVEEGLKCILESFITIPHTFFVKLLPKDREDQVKNGITSTRITSTSNYFARRTNPLFPDIFPISFSNLIYIQSFQILCDAGKLADPSVLLTGLDIFQQSPPKLMGTFDYYYYRRLLFDYNHYGFLQYIFW
jgi:hypothetical protein